MRLEDDYIKEDVKCELCGKVYNPAEQAKLATFVMPPIWANNFCSRKCLDDKAAQLPK